MPAAPVAPPANFPGPLTEWLTLQALVRLGKRLGEDFTYQSAIEGGRTEKGGLVIDFLFTNPPDLAINPQGLHFHYGLGAGKIASDKIARAVLAGLGITLIFIDEDDLTRDAVFYVKEALAYRDHSRLAKGF